jgi:hypothetical protein
MAADSATFQNELMFQCYEPKIVRARDGSLIGASGAAGDCIFLREWVRSGMDFKNPPNFSWKDVDSDHSILWLWLRGPNDVHMGDCTMNHWPVPVPTTIGFGSHFVTALLAAGMELTEAVALTIKRTPYLGGSVQVEHLQPALAEVAD